MIVDVSLMMSVEKKIRDSHHIKNSWKLLSFYFKKYHCWLKGFLRNNFALKYLINLALKTDNDSTKDIEDERIMIANKKQLIGLRCFCFSLI